MEKYRPRFRLEDIEVPVEERTERIISSSSLYSNKRNGDRTFCFDNQTNVSDNFPPHNDCEVHDECLPNKNKSQCKCVNDEPCGTYDDFSYMYD